MPASVVFDILLIGDFRFPGGTSTAIATEIQAQARAGYRTGLLALKGPILKHPHPYHPAIRRLLDQGAATLVDPRRPIRATLTLAHHPQVFTHLPTSALDLDTDLALLVIHHPAFDGADAAAYDPLTCNAHCEAFLGRGVVWAPVGPAVRHSLERFRGQIEILDFDWSNCLDPADWSGPRQEPSGPRPIIGRHSRPDPLKWPPNREAVLEVYPDDPAIDVRILGGGAFLDSLMGSYPANWRVEPFDPEAPVIYTAHVHRRDGSDMGLYDDLYAPISDRAALIDETLGSEIFPDLAPAPGEHIIKKHRYSAFFATDLDLILREWGIETLIVTGTTTENCCHATARDAMFRNYKVAFMSDCTGSFDYPDVGQGAMSAEDVHQATLTILAFSTADVMTADELRAKVATAARAKVA